MGFSSIVNLRLTDIPAVDAPLDDLYNFAHTFNGYEYWGSFERCASIAHASDHSSLDCLRTCLFFQARCWRHTGISPDGKAEIFWRQLVEDIRCKVKESGQLDLSPSLKTQE